MLLQHVGLHSDLALRGVERDHVEVLGPIIDPHDIVHRDGRTLAEVLAGKSTKGDVVIEYTPALPGDRAAGQIYHLKVVGYIDLAVGTHVARWGNRRAVVTQNDRGHLHSRIGLSFFKLQDSFMMACKAYNRDQQQER